MSELHDKARALLERARGIGHGPARDEWVATVSELLAENEQIKRIADNLQRDMAAECDRAEAAEARLRELASEEPVAWQSDTAYELTCFKKLGASWLPLIRRPEMPS